jgi:hypothetical protein
LSCVRPYELIVFFFQQSQYFSSDGTSASLIGHYSVIRHLCVEWPTRSLQFPQNFSGVAALQQRPLTIPPGSGNELLNRAVQINYQTARSQMSPVIFTQNRPATGGKDNTFPPSQLIDNRRFALTKTGLALNVENPRDLRACSTLYFMIRVKERPAQCIRQLTTDGTFSHRHKAYQKYVLHRHGTKCKARQERDEEI